MKNKILIGICIFLIVIAPVYSLTKTYESTSVARMVGDNPEDLARQLEKEDIYLSHATSYVNDKWYQLGMGDANEIIKSEFSSYVIKEGNINWNDVNNDLSKFRKNELFVLSPDYDDVMNYEGLTPSSVSSWQNAFSGNEPLFIFDAQYSGLYLPKKDSFVSRLSKYSTMITPLSYSSKEMVKSVICNLKDGREIGDSFRQARNNYYWGTEANEPIGLTMLSYEMYGDPMSKVFIPNYQQSVINKYCEDYNEEYKKNSKVKKTMLASADNKIRIIYEIYIDNYNTESTGNYEILTIDNGLQKSESFELVLPFIVHKTELPLKTVVTGFGASFGDPVNVDANIPEWQEGFAERKCFNNTKEQYASFAQSYTRDKEVVLAYLNPVEVADCINGNLKLYKKIIYWIDYIPYSNILINEVSSEDKSVNFGNNITVYVDLENIGQYSEDGYLTISENGNEYAKASVSVDSLKSNKIELNFNAPDYDGTKIFDVFYEDDGIKLSQSSFNIEIIQDIYAPDPNNPNCPPKCVGLDLWIYLAARDNCVIYTENIIHNHKFCYPNKNELTNSNGEIEKTYCVDYCDKNTLYHKGHFYGGECTYEVIEQNSASCSNCLSFENSKHLYLPNGNYSCQNSYSPAYNEPGSTDEGIYYNVKLSDVVCSLSGGGIYKKIVYNSRECGYDPCKNVKCDNYCDGKTSYSQGRCSEGKCSYNLIEEKSKDCGYNPCEGVVCDDKCQGLDYYDDGQCSGGNCVYTITKNSRECGYDPCAGVNCENYCDGYKQYTNGVCSEGKCSYALEENSKECGYDPCKNVKCDNYCNGKLFYSSGVCNAGKCEYSTITNDYTACIIPQCEIIGDITNDGTIDINDGLKLLSHIGGAPLPETICCYDVTRDKKIDIFDFLQLMDINGGNKKAEPISECN